MKKMMLLPIATFIIGISFGQGDPFVTTIGSENYISLDILKTSDGGFVITGWSYYFEQAAQIGEAEIAKLDSNGFLEWNLLLTGNDPAIMGDEADYLTSVIQLDDGGYLAAGTVNSVDPAWNWDDSDVFLLRLSDIGEVLWSKRLLIEPNHDHAVKIVQLFNDGFLVLVNSSLPDQSDNVILAIKVDMIGDVIWSSRIGSIKYETPRDVLPTHDGGVLLFGSSTSNADGEDMMVMKLDDEGTLQWDRTFMSPVGSRIVAVAPLANSEIMMVGDHGAHLLLMKMLEDGELVWTRTFAYGSDLNASSILVEDNGDLLISANGYAVGDSIPDPVAFRADPDGVVLTSVKYEVGSDFISIRERIADESGGHTFIMQAYSTMDRVIRTTADSLGFYSPCQPYETVELSELPTMPFATQSTMTQLPPPEAIVTSQVWETSQPWLAGTDCIVNRMNDQDTTMERPWLHPNPCVDRLEIDVALDRGELLFELSTVTGQRILYGSLGGERQLDVSSLPSGIYNCMITDDAGSRQSTKVVVQR